MQSLLAPLLSWITHYGYAALFGLLMVGIVGLPVPDETLLVFSGYLISRGRLHSELTFIAGFAGSVCGISLSYWIGRSLGHGFVHRYGKYVHLTQARLQRAHQWFQRIGAWTLTLGYFIPGVRHFTALVAGTSDLEYRTFAAFAYPGAALWVGSFLTLGYLVGDRWQQVSEAVHRYALAFAALVIAASAIFLWWRRRSSGLHRR